MSAAGKRVLVCGGRDYAGRADMFRDLDALHASDGIECIISGCARGADTLAIQWAIARGVTVAQYPADWITHGRGAGPVRNQQMLTEGKPDVVVAYPGGRGTKDTIDRARRAGVPVMHGGAL